MLKSGSLIISRNSGIFFTQEEGNCFARKSVFSLVVFFFITPKYGLLMLQHLHSRYTSLLKTIL